MNQVEAFEKILISNGYEKYNPSEKDINQLIESGSKKKKVFIFNR